QQADFVVVRVVVSNVRREAVVLQGQTHQRLDARRVGPRQQGRHAVLVAEQCPQRGLYFVGRVGIRTDREVLVQQPVGFVQVFGALDCREGGGDRTEIVAGIESGLQRQRIHAIDRADH